ILFKSDLLRSALKLFRGNLLTLVASSIIMCPIPSPRGVTISPSIPKTRRQTPDPEDMPYYARELRRAIKAHYLIDK
ncbi:MAG: hypothetical protein NT011_07840, partial [Kiritimatiellaeota bacterium]|nr:hypothetical protein [Kiritimatiellota bacterium]